MADKKSTADIMAALRAETARKKAAAEGQSPPDDAAPAAPAEAAAPDSTASAPPAAQPAAPTGGAAKPKSTADILAAARAQSGGGQQPAAAAPAGNDDRPAAAKPAAAKPKSTADILAAARKQSAGGGGTATATAAPAAKPAAAQPAAKASAAAPGGAKPSVEEMLRAVREGKPMPAAEPKAAVAKPIRKPVAARSAKVGAKTETGSRRAFVLATLASPFVLAWVLFGGALAAFTAGMARFMMPNVLVEPPSRFNVGPVGRYSPDSVSEDFKASNGVWVVRTSYEGQEMIYALISVCTHLGCTPGWLQSEQKFKCPCHGSGFYITGINFEGPAPRPLERAGIFLMPDGSLEVDKSVKFQQEMGQWNDAASFVELA